MTEELKRKVTPVILAGGRGERLRPLTSAKSPKPFLRLFSKNSLFQNTVLRVLHFGDPVVVCHASYLPFVKQHLKGINVTPRAIILEPEHKGTAAAIALAAFYLKNQGETMLVLPSDQVIEGGPVFSDCVMRAVEFVSDRFVMLGVKPLRADTGYGYIKRAEISTSVGEVSSFVEKPDAEMARSYLCNRGFLWNTGIFLSQPRVYLRLLKEFDLDIYRHSERAYFAHEEFDGGYWPDAENFSHIIPNSVDYAILEKYRGSYVCEMDVFWDDVGTWPRVLRFGLRKLFKMG